MKNPSRRPCCGFCGRDLADVELLFIGDIGGIPDAICDGCLTRYYEVVKLHRRAPDLAGSLIAAQNAVVEQAKRAH